MALKSYSCFKKKKKEKKPKKEKSEFMKRPISSGIKLGLGFAALGLGLSAMDRI